MKSKRHKYKAIICDLDGTLIPNRPDGMPSKGVIEAVAKASQEIHFGIATARPYFITKHIVEHLKLSGPSIVHGGAQIIDLTTGKILKEQKISIESLLKVYKITKKLKVPFYIDEENETVLMPMKWTPHDLLGAVFPSLTLKQAKLLENELSKISGISIHRIPDWRKKENITVDINHASVGKQYAILEIAQILKIKTSEIIAVGDGPNDFPLLMACGLKVAMGNAVAELKEIADYIAPSVDEDGVVDVIEKFIL